jgi:hypothetical protein
LFSTNSFSQENHNTNKGYKIEGDHVVFIFNVNDYPNIKHNGEPINDVFVSGEFNDWALDQWKMNKVNDSIYQLPKKRSFFVADIDWEFKFIINGKHWAEPSDSFENIVDALDYKGKRLMTYNLKLYNAFITDSGNVTFELKGYKDAKNVILSGSFNRWDETKFKMKPTDYGWELTLQLRPGIYEYKFIVKYSLILKVFNYSKWIEDT